MYTSVNILVFCIFGLIDNLGTIIDKIVKLIDKLGKLIDKIPLLIDKLDYLIDNPEKPLPKFRNILYIERDSI